MQTRPNAISTMNMANMDMVPFSPTPTQTLDSAAEYDLNSELTDLYIAHTVHTDTHTLPQCILNQNA